MKDLGLKVFAATRMEEVQNLGAVVTEWIRSHPELAITDREVYQSFCVPYQCLTITLSYSYRSTS